MEINRDIDALEARLNESDCVRFVFVKLDNSIREAHGTRRLLAIPHDLWPKGMRKASPGVLTFYDIDKGEWRCLRRSSLLGWFEVE